MPKKILYGPEARQTILKGVDALANAVKITLGPRGRNAVLERPMGPPLITKDGVTVAKDISVPDPLENMGAALVQEVASRTADMAGDGTTTATLLAQFIYREGLLKLETGANPVALKRGIDGAVTVVVEELARRAVQVGRDPEAIARVGTISANGDRTIGDIIAKAMEAVGIDGMVDLGDSLDSTTHLEITNGMQFDRGWISRWFVTDFEKGETDYEDCAILITERKIANQVTLQAILGESLTRNFPLLVIADDVEGQAVALQIANRRERGLKIVSVRAPSYGEYRRDILEDIAILTGAYAFIEGAPKTLDSLSKDDLGFAKHVTVTAGRTSIVEGKGNPEEVAQRIRDIKRSIEESQDDGEKDRLKQRLARMAGGVAVIKVGAPSETEAKELKARVEDAIHATRAAAEEGIVEGGGTALIRCATRLMEYCESNALSRDEADGANIIFRALYEPLRTICANAGVNPEPHIKTIEDGGAGYNAEKGEHENLIRAGIVDPVKVTRLALQNSASVASVMLTTETLVSEVRTPANTPLVGGHLAPM